jgi:hypothetical protein
VSFFCEISLIWILSGQNGLNLNLHAHAIFIEGVYAMSDGVPVFYHLPGPEDIEVAQIVDAISNSTIAVLRTMGYVSEEGTPVDRPEAIDKVFADSEQLTATAHASNQMRIAFGERAGEKVRLLAIFAQPLEKVKFLESMLG